VELPAGGGAPVRPGGGLAGSALRLDRAVGNAVGLGLGLAEAVAAASRIPADLIGQPGLGRLAAGATADLAWLGDDLRARATWVSGAQVYGSR
jgi:N-acetylglucosamine-6-phosphate deacetylase